LARPASGVPNRPVDIPRPPSSAQKLKYTSKTSNNGKSKKTHIQIFNLIEFLKQMSQIEHGMQRIIMIILMNNFHVMFLWQYLYVFLTVAT
jgi:hypothetical protein